MNFIDRYLPPSRFNSVLESLPKQFKLSVIGKSVLNQPIYGIKIGSGKTKVLMWSQMHGNESTTTKAIYDLILSLSDSGRSISVEGLTLYIIPQLNPDGAEAYTRLNSNAVDLNRDALDLSQPESKVLRKVFKDFKPDFCFNLHGQRTIFSAGRKGKTATVSFLAPAADPERSVTSARREAMQVIAAMSNQLQQSIPDQIGRFDDTFNHNCVGDYFSCEGIPTILFEAGHYSNDYNRNITRKFILEALEYAIDVIQNKTYLNFSVSEYLKIPENHQDYVDILCKNVTIKEGAKVFYNQEMAVQFIEELEGDKIKFQPSFHSFGDRIELLAHKTIDFQNSSSPSVFYFSQGENIDNEGFWPFH